MGWDWLVTLTLVVHFGYLVYLALGGFLAWRWPKAIWPHLAAVVWGILVVAIPLTCPLTWAEDAARQLAGQAPLQAGFIDRYLDDVIYPERYVGLVRLALGVLIGGSWWGAHLAHRRRRAATYRVDTPTP